MWSHQMHFVLPPDIYSCQGIGLYLAKGQDEKGYHYHSNLCSFVLSPGLVQTCLEGVA